MAANAREAVTTAALDGDAAALRTLAERMPPLESSRYERHRARAFAAAIDGRHEQAATQLQLASAGRRSFGRRVAIDLAILELIRGDLDAAVAQITVARRLWGDAEPDVRAVLAECARRAPGNPALRVALAGATPFERATTASVVGAKALAARRLEIAVPPLVAASLVVALVSFVRLPGLLSGNGGHSAAPGLRDRDPIVVVASPRPERSPRPRTRTFPTSRLPVAAVEPPAPPTGRSTARAQARRPAVRTTRPRARSAPPAPTSPPPPAPAPAAAEPTVVYAVAAPPQSPSAAPAAPPPPQTQPPKKARAPGQLKKEATPAGGAVSPTAPPAAEQPAAAADAAPPGPPAHAPAHGNRDDGANGNGNGNANGHGNGK